MVSSHLFALGAAMTWGLSSQGLSLFSRRVSPLWLNAFKASLAFVFFGIFILISGDFYFPAYSLILLLMLSGLIGLNLGDLLLMNAFAALGPTRTLIVYRCHPIILGLMGFLFLGQEITLNQAIGILVLLLCVVLLSYEGKRGAGTWEVRGLLFAFGGVVLDACGVMVSRIAFDADIRIDSGLANIFRCLGALIGFIFVSRIWRIGLVKNFVALPPRLQAAAVGTVFVGTFLTLFLWMSAVQHGRLAVVSAIWGLAPISAAFFEFLFTGKPPTRYVLLALVLSVGGLTLLMVPVN